MGRLLRTEWYKLFHDKIFMITLAACVLFNGVIFSGSPILNCSGAEALRQCMKKEIMTAMIVCIYGGIFLGSDFADRTMYHGLTAGQSRSAVLQAKIIVFSAAADLLLFLFPLLLTVICTTRNGWGAAAGTGLILHIVRHRAGTASSRVRDFRHFTASGSMLSRRRPHDWDSHRLIFYCDHLTQQRLCSSIIAALSHQRRDAGRGRNRLPRLRHGARACMVCTAGRCFHPDFPPCGTALGGI